MFSWSISSPRLNVGCRRYRKINPLSLTAADLGAGWWGSCREREKKRERSHQLYRELSSCMHECSHPHPLSIQQKWKKKKKGNERDHHNGGVPARTEPALRT